MSPNTLNPAALRPPPLPPTDEAESVPAHSPLGAGLAPSQAVLHSARRARWWRSASALAALSVPMPAWAAWSAGGGDGALAIWLIAATGLAVAGGAATWLPRGPSNVAAVRTRAAAAMAALAGGVATGAAMLALALTAGHAFLSGIALVWAVAVAAAAGRAYGFAPRPGRALGDSLLFQGPLPAPRTMDERLQRRKAVAKAATGYLASRRHTADLVRRRLRPWGVAAIVAPVLPALAWSADASALLVVWAATNVVAGAAGLLALRRRERPSRGYAVAAGASALGLGPAAAIATGDVAFATLVAIIGQVALAALLATLAVAAHDSAEREVPAPMWPHLVEAVGSPDETVREAVHAVLRERSGADLPADPRLWRHWLQDSLESGGRLPQP